MHMCDLCVCCACDFERKQLQPPCLTCACTRHATHSSLSQFIYTSQFTHNTQTLKTPHNSYVHTGMPHMHPGMPPPFPGMPPASMAPPQPTPTPNAQPQQPGVYQCSWSHNGVHVFLCNSCAIFHNPRPWPPPTTLITLTPPHTGMPAPLFPISSQAQAQPLFPVAPGAFVCVCVRVCCVFCSPSTQMPDRACIYETHTQNILL